MSGCQVARRIADKTDDKLASYSVAPQARGNRELSMQPRTSYGQAMLSEFKDFNPQYYLVFGVILGTGTGGGGSGVSLDCSNFCSRSNIVLLCPSS